VTRSLAAQHNGSIVLKTFVSTNNTLGRHFCPKLMFRTIFRGKGLKRERACPFASQVTKAKRHLPRVGYINLTTGLMATTPSPGVTNSPSQTSLSQPTAWCSFLFTSGEALTSLSFFISLSLTDPFFLRLYSINLVLISLRPHEQATYPTLNDLTPSHVALTSV